MARLARKARLAWRPDGWEARLAGRSDWLESQVGLEARLARLAGNARLAGKARWVGLGGKIGWESQMGGPGGQDWLGGQTGLNLILHLVNNSTLSNNRLS